MQWITRALVLALHCVCVCVYTFVKKKRDEKQDVNKINKVGCRFCHLDFFLRLHKSKWDCCLWLVCGLLLCTISSTAVHNRQHQSTLGQVGRIRRRNPFIICFCFVLVACFADCKYHFEGENARIEMTTTAIATVTDLPCSSSAYTICIIIIILFTG